MFDFFLPLGDHQYRLAKAVPSGFRRTTLTAVLLVFGLIVSLVGPAQAMVVCVGADGHVDVEVALGGCSSSPVADGVATLSSFDSAHYGCGGCTDLRLNSPGLQANHLRLKPPGPVLNESAAAMGPIQFSVSAGSLIELNSPALSLTFDLLASVVLLN